MLNVPSEMENSESESCQPSKIKYVLICSSVDEMHAIARELGMLQKEVTILRHELDLEHPPPPNPQDLMTMIPRLEIDYSDLKPEKERQIHFNHVKPSKSLNNRPINNRKYKNIRRTK